MVNDAKQGMENALRAKPLDIREQLKELQEAYGEAMLELRARIKLPPCSARTTDSRRCLTGITRRGYRGLRQ